MGFDITGMSPKNLHIEEPTRPDNLYELSKEDQEKYFDKRDDNSTISIIKCNANIVVIFCALAVILAPLYFNNFIDLIENNVMHIIIYGR